MIPTGGSITSAPVEEGQQPSLTYRLDITTGRITGRVDGLEAVKQAVFKIVQTERFRHLIYSFDYGFESDGMIGSDPPMLRSDLPRRVREALMQDDRITGVVDFNVDISGDTASAAFTVISIFGNIQERVTLGV